MAKNDIQIIRGGGQTLEFPVEDRTTSSDTVLFGGEPVKKGGTGGNFATHLATAEPTNASGTIMLGVTIDGSTETSTVDGIVNIQLLIPGKSVLRTKATDPTAINTDAKILAITGDAIDYDLSGITFTIDENSGDDPNVKGLLVIGGDPVTGTLDYVIKDYALEQSSSY